MLGKIANANTNTPIPPTKWVKLRQNNEEYPKIDKSLKILEPVVVKPLAVSKNASAKFGISPANTNGNPPKNDNKIQLNATVTIPSRGMIFIFLGFASVQTVPITTNKAIVPA